NFNGQNQAVYRNSSGTFFSTDDNHTGVFIVKTYDVTKRYVSGTFYFEGVKNGNTVVVTDGKFGGVY
ncbi:MAG: hypothetical protein Q8M94_02565, partial [Ignavibacteria bacterium]|nr:hypothetical protein [Ignavibacteria bacterium]